MQLLGYQTKTATPLLDSASELMRQYIEITKQYHINHMLQDPNRPDFSPSDDPFLRQPYNQSPPCISMDSTMQPLVILSQILNAKIESNVMNLCLNLPDDSQETASNANYWTCLASRVQSGHILTDNSHKIAIDNMNKTIKAEMEMSSKVLSYECVKDCRTINIEKENFRRMSLKFSNGHNSDITYNVAKSNENSMQKGMVSPLVASLRALERPMTDELTTRPASGDSKSSGWRNTRSNASKEQKYLIDTRANEDIIGSYQSLLQMVSNSSSSLLRDPLNSEDRNFTNDSFVLISQSGQYSGSTPKVAGTKTSNMRKSTNIRRMSAYDDTSGGLSSRPTSSHSRPSSAPPSLRISDVSLQAIDLLKRRYNIDIKNSYKLNDLHDSSNGISRTPSSASFPVNSKQNNGLTTANGKNGLDEVIQTGILANIEEGNESLASSIVSHPKNASKTVNASSLGQGPSTSLSSPIASTEVDNSVPIEEYNPNKHDSSTIRSELLLGVDCLGGAYGRDDVSLYVLWVISMIDGFGYGMFGTSSSLDIAIASNVKQDDNTLNQGPRQSYEGHKNLQEETTIEPNKHVSNSCNTTFLEEVKDKLVEMDASLDQEANKITNQSKSSDKININIADSYCYRITVRKRYLLTMVLIKIFYLLNNRREVYKYIKQLEKLYNIYIRNEGNSYEMTDACARNNVAIDYHYLAISKRFKLQYEQWISIVSRSEKKFHHFVSIILPTAKEYAKYALLGKDIVMKRDALKQLMNIYIEISRLPCKKDDESKPTGTSSPVSRKTGLSKVDNNYENEWLSTSFLSIQELELQYKPHEIEEKESTNPFWVRHVSKARALQILRQMKSLTQ